MVKLSFVIKNRNVFLDHIIYERYYGEDYILYVNLTKNKKKIISKVDLSYKITEWLLTGKFWDSHPILLNRRYIKMNQKELNVCLMSQKGKLSIVMRQIVNIFLNQK